MTKLEKEQAIINGIKQLPFTQYGEYHSLDDLCDIISRVMGFTSRRIHWDRPVWNYQETEKLWTIIDRMESKNVISRSKSGTMFKLNRNI